MFNEKKFLFQAQTYYQLLQLRNIFSYNAFEDSQHTTIHM